MSDIVDQVQRLNILVDANQSLRSKLKTSVMKRSRQALVEEHQQVLRALLSLLADMRSKVKNQVNSEGYQRAVAVPSTIGSDMALSRAHRLLLDKQQAREEQEPQAQSKSKGG